MMDPLIPCVEVISSPSVHPALAVASIANLGGLLREQGQLEEATALFREVRRREGSAGAEGEEGEGRRGKRGRGGGRQRKG